MLAEGSVFRIRLLAFNSSRLHSCLGTKFVIEAGKISKIATADLNSTTRNAALALNYCRCLLRPWTACACRNSFLAVTLHGSCLFIRLENRAIACEMRVEAEVGRTNF
jgi:hypothetical protein